MYADNPTLLARKDSPDLSAQKIRKAKCGVVLTNTYPRTHALYIPYDVLLHFARRPSGGTHDESTHCTWTWSVEAGTAYISRRDRFCEEPFTIAHTTIPIAVWDELRAMTR